MDEFQSNNHSKRSYISFKILEDKFYTIFWLKIFNGKIEENKLTFY